MRHSFYDYWSMARYYVTSYPRRYHNRIKYNLKKEDYIAMGLTAIIVIILGIILWFIPATNGFIKDMLPFLK